ncbi:Asp23/Gls24 family envelope stress response protein [Pseudonocardia spinosispora]|uniref:Asp23/Gls24 family envelope stress response protein n=1 Tax=Pseudonocardia spinosispora TaxID=103441 RepID=UPI0012EBFE1F|nr:Asp23/Gls24 family envelope stress response protein [Pseudonocardia spinosispora]
MSDESPDLSHPPRPDDANEFTAATAHDNSEVAAAAAAATAVRATAGVVRLQPRIWGLVHQLSQQMWERATGKAYPDTAGVDATVDGDTVAVEIALVLHGGYQATAVADAVQRAVPAAVAAATGLTVTTVTVRVTDIDLTSILA